MRNYNGERMRTITVAELIEALQEQDPDAMVLFSTDYGDYHHTPQALPLRGEIEQATIEKSAYSNSGFAISATESDDEDFDGADDNTTYLVIR